MTHTLVIVVPAKNEEKNLGKVLDSIIANVEETDIGLKIYVVIVDDASNDNTPLIAQKYSRNYEYISYIRLKHNKKYDSSIGLVRAVKAGIRYIENKGIKWDFFMQVDADTVLLTGYIKNIMQPMLVLNDVGIAGGITVNEQQARLHVRNTGMVVRREVWVQCGGYKPFPSPDTIIQLCSIANGWKILIVHTAKMFLLRPTRLNIYRAGFVDGATGSSIVHATIRSAKLAISNKSIKSLIDYWSGYIAGKIHSNNYIYLNNFKPYKQLIEKIRLKDRIINYI